MGRALLISGLLMMFSNVMFMILAATGNSYWMMVAAICTENLTSGIGLTVFATYLSGLSSIAYTATQFALLSSFAGVGRTCMAGPAGIVAENFGGYFLEYNNFIPADPLKTPAHIAPVWYFTPFYSMLRAITTEMMYVLVLCVVAGAGFGVLKAKLPSFIKAGIAGAAVVVVLLMLSIDAKFWGVVVMGGAVIILFFLPWLDFSPVKSIRYRPDWHKYLY
eukprot:gene58801-80531_t